MREGRTHIERVHTLVTLTEVLDHRTARGTLPNGKVVFAFLTGNKALELVAGHTWPAVLNVADFSRAELVEPKA
jgi:hypothetical protein